MTGVGMQAFLLGCLYAYQMVVFMGPGGSPDNPKFHPLERGPRPLLGEVFRDEDAYGAVAGGDVPLGISLN